MGSGEKKQWKLLQKIGTKNGPKSITGNMVVLGFVFAGKNPTKAEKARIDHIQDELDALLYDQRKSAPYYGNLHGENYVEGECRLFLTCPDADVLAKRLRPWLRKLDWPGEVFALKRYGEYVDPEAREEFVEF